MKQWSVLRKVVKILDGQPGSAKGQSLVELALTTPFLILMVMGMAEIGLIANNYLILQEVVRGAARQATSLDPKEFQPGDARNYERLDCDMHYNQYTLLGGLNGDPLRIGNPRGPSGMGYFEGPQSPFPEVGTGAAQEKQVALGFFDAIACQALRTMDPLIFDDSPGAKDEVIVSAVSYALRDVGGGNHKVVVTGRWPLENRYCAGGFSGSTASSGDYRDPFNFLGQPNITLPPDSGPNSTNTKTINYELSDPNWPLLWGPTTDGGAFYHIDSAGNPTSPPFNKGNQGIRGYVFEGRVVQNDGCMGSQFTVSDIESRLNIDVAPNGMPTNDPNGFTSPLNNFVPNGGLVIIEMYWQHHPLLLGPLFQGFTGNKINDPVLNVWQIFPVTSLEPTATP